MCDNEVKEVSAYQCSNGEVFVDLKQAEKLQVYLNFVDWYDNLTIGYPQNNLGHISDDELFYWLDNNKDYLLNLLQTLKAKS